MTLVRVKEMKINASGIDQFCAKSRGSKSGPKLSSVYVATYPRESEMSDGATSWEWLEMQSAPTRSIEKELIERSLGV